MRKPNNSRVVTKTVKKEIIEIDSDTDASGGRMLALCGEVNAIASRELPNTGETNIARMQIVCADDFYPVSDYDMDYQKYLAICGGNGNPYLLEDIVRESTPLPLMYNVDNRATDPSKGRVVIKTKRNVVKGAVKDKKKNVVKGAVKDKKKNVVKGAVKKEKRGRKPKPLKISNESKSLKKNGVKGAVKKEKRGRKPKLLKNSNTSKRLKTDNGRADRRSSSRNIPVVKTKDGRRKKVEALRERKIPVTKNNVKSKATSCVKDKSTHTCKACKKKNEERLLPIDKSYEYYLAYLRNSITIFQPDRQPKRKRDPVCLSDRDVIISDHPFADAPFETNKGDKVIDLEEGIKLADKLNTLYSKKLMEVLRRPYQQNEFLNLNRQVSLKKPLNRSRQLRDGREIEFVVHKQLGPSYLEQFPEFKTKLRRCVKDPPRGLNLLRGLFFYLENITVEGAFPPWKYEKDLHKLCFDDRRCTDIVCIKNPT